MLRMDIRKRNSNKQMSNMTTVNEFHCSTEYDGISPKYIDNDGSVAHRQTPRASPPSSQPPQPSSQSNILAITGPTMEQEPVQPVVEPQVIQMVAEQEEIEAELGEAEGAQAITPAAEAVEVYNDCEFIPGSPIPIFEVDSDDNTNNE